MISDRFRTRIDYERNCLFIKCIRLRDAGGLICIECLFEFEVFRQEIGKI